MGYFLLLDDDELDRHMLTERFRRQFPDHKVVEAATLGEAEHLLNEAVRQNNPPSVILLDGSLTSAGTLDTLDFIDTAKRLGCHKIIATSMSPDFRDQMLQRGCSAKASKFDRDGLEAAIHSLLAS